MSKRLPSSKIPNSFNPMVRLRAPPEVSMDKAFQKPNGLAYRLNALLCLTDEQTLPFLTQRRLNGFAAKRSKCSRVVKLDRSGCWVRYHWGKLFRSAFTFALTHNRHGARQRLRPHSSHQWTLYRSIVQRQCQEA